MKYYPISLDLRGRRCLVVGGGKVADRTVQALLHADADLTVISPKLSAAIKVQLRKKRLRHFKRRYQSGDLRGYFLAYAATGHSEVDVLMASEAVIEGVLLNVLERSVLCSFLDPAVGRPRSSIV